MYIIKKNYQLSFRGLRTNLLGYFFFHFVFETFCLDDAPINRNGPYVIKDVIKTELEPPTASVTLGRLDQNHTTKLEIPCGREGSNGLQSLHEKV